MEVKLLHPAFAWLAALVLAPLVSLAGCTANGPPDEAESQWEPETAASALSGAEPTGSGRVLVTLEPWGEINFEFGRFRSINPCRTLVRSSPSFSGYTSSERCESITDPVYCTVWRDEDNEPDSIGCHKGMGGCGIELEQHDLRVAAGTRTVMRRCESYSLNDAWSRYEAAQERLENAAP